MDRNKGTCVKRGVLLDCIDYDNGVRFLLPINSIVSISTPDDISKDGQVFIVCAYFATANGEQEHIGVTLVYSLDEISDIING